MAERVCVIVPTYNESAAIAGVVTRIRQALPAALPLIVNDGSTDDTAERARNAGARVVDLPVNLGIGGAVQTGYRFALRGGFDVAVQVDGDGQHDPAEVRHLLQAIHEQDADLVVGSRWLGRGEYVSPAGRRVGMRVLATMVRWRIGQALTDTTSGFRAAGPRAIRLFARRYPPDFPEVEALVLARRNGLRVVEVPVTMARREFGRSSIAGLRSAYYMARVGLALVVDAVREDSA